MLCGDFQREHKILPYFSKKFYPLGFINNGPKFSIEQPGCCLKSFIEGYFCNNREDME